jgi:hypothetical protein
MTVLVGTESDAEAKQTPSIFHRRFSFLVNIAHAAVDERGKGVAEHVRTAVEAVR